MGTLFLAALMIPLHVARMKGADDGWVCEDDNVSDRWDHALIVKHGWAAIG